MTSLDLDRDQPSRNPNVSQDEDQLAPSESLTLETPILQIPDQNAQLQVKDPDDEEEEEHEHEQLGIVSSSSTPPLQLGVGTYITITDHDTDLDPDPVTENPPLTSPATHSALRRVPSKRKKHMATKKRQAITKKLQLLAKTFKPIPFRPNHFLDFPTHEKLLKRLGLWEFAHVELECTVRIDLLAQFVVNYSPQNRATYINERRIIVSRAQLARALKLPVKKDKITVVEVEEDEESLSEESISFLQDLVSNRILLHEDTWILPSEVSNLIKFIREGHPEKVDWASLMWYMVEKEISQRSRLGDCYYASHLQCLIKSQRDCLFLEEDPMVDFTVKEKEEEYVSEVKVSDDNKDVKMGDDRDDVKMEMDGCDLTMATGYYDLRMGTDRGDSKMGIDGNYEVNELDEEANIELSLGQDFAEKDHLVQQDDVMDFEENKEEEHDQWSLNVKNDGLFLRPCNQEEEKQELDVEEEDGFTLLPNCNLEEIEASNIPYNTQFTLRSESNPDVGGPSFFGNANKREIDNDYDISRQKRQRSNEPWQQQKPFDFDQCMNDSEHFFEKARMLYQEKERTCIVLNTNLEVMMNEVQERDNIIEQLHKVRFEEQQKKQVEFYRLQQELFNMEKLLVSYRKALKETRSSFSAYRKLCPVQEEPIYKDVVGSGGLVLSIMDHERLKIRQEEEDRAKCEEMQMKVKEFKDYWNGVFEEHANLVNEFTMKMMNVETKFKLLKEIVLDQKAKRVEDSPKNE